MISLKTPDFRDLEATLFVLRSAENLLLRENITKRISPAMRFVTVIRPKISNSSTKVMEMMISLRIGDSMEKELILIFRPTPN